MAKETKAQVAQAKKETKEHIADLAFGRENYRMLLIGLALIVAGFVLMIGGGSDDPKVFNEAVFNFQRLTLAPLLILTGYVIEIFAIMKKPRD
jgi:hypothetical protein